MASSFDGASSDRAGQLPGDACEIAGIATVNLTPEGARSSRSAASGDRLGDVPGDVRDLRRPRTLDDAAGRAALGARDG